MIDLRALRVSRTQQVAVAVVIAVLVSVPLWGQAYLWSFLSLTLMWVGLTLSWNLISGYSGYVSLGHTAFFGMGAYVGALLYSNLGIPWGVAAILAGISTLLIAIPIGYTLLRLRGPFFAVGMLGLSEVFRITVNRLSAWTGGGHGLYLDTSADIWWVYIGFLAVAVAAFAVTWLIDSVPYGRALLAIRDDEEAAEVLGTRTTRSKVSAFVISAFFPGVIGTIYAMYISYIDPSSVFNIEYNLVIVLMGALGGTGTVIGPVIGAVIIGGMREAFWVTFPRLHLIAFGVAMVATVLVWPDGLYPRLVALGRRLRGEDTDAGPREAKAVGDIEIPPLDGPPAQRTDRDVLVLREVDKIFAGRKVIDGCSLAVKEGSITGLIGPNGSGKTTTLNLVNKLLVPDGGRIEFDGQRIDDLPAYAIAEAGIGRTFQIPRLFDRLSVLDNMLVASPDGLDRAAGLERTAQRLEFVGLTGFEERPAGKLSYGQRKLLEIGRSLMGDPGLILMDEPFAGVNPILRERITELIRALRDRGITFVVIGHEMAEMMSLCEHMIVMDQGAVIAEGAPSEIQDNDLVFEAYFGRRPEFLPQGGAQ